MLDFSCGNLFTLKYSKIGERKIPFAPMSPGKCLHVSCRATNGPQNQPLTIYENFYCCRWSPQTKYGCHRWSPQTIYGIIGGPSDHDNPLKTILAISWMDQDMYCTKSLAAIISFSLAIDHSIHGVLISSYNIDITTAM